MLNALPFFPYEKIYVAFKEIPVEAQEVGCALVVAPYITLARNAIPRGGTGQLAESNLAQWQAGLSLPNRGYEVKE